MMKRILSLILVVIMILSVLAACKGGDTATDADNNSGEAPVDSSMGASDDLQAGNEDGNSLLLTLDAKYVIVRPSDCDSAITDAQDVALKEVKLRLLDDLYRIILDEARNRFCIQVY